MNAVQCDYCGKFAANPTNNGMLRGRYTNKLPDDWISVGAWQGGMTDGATVDEHGEFCSRDCVSKHFGRPFDEMVAA